ncbi:hypothetical protein GGR56DRAFT_64309 [Xylariaceae sp. FL0804]|nr:hypothetical protein GGR56DRAFT_64309 [Xylariaceae sp. FL0804]
MNTTSTPPPSQRRASSSYSRFFRPRQASRRLKKRNSLPVQLVDEKQSFVAISIDAVDTEREKEGVEARRKGEKKMEEHEQERERKENCPAALPVAALEAAAAGRPAVRCSDLDNSRPLPRAPFLPTSPVHHRGARSRSVLVPRRPRYDESRLMPLPVRSGPTMGSVMAAKLPFAPPSAGYHRDSFGAREAPAYAADARRPTRLPPAMMGNYAQIDAQPNMYQRRPSSSASTASSRASDSFDSILASPTSSRTSFDSWHSAQLPRNGYQRPAPIKQYRRRRGQGEMLAALPEEVLSLILEELRELHLHALSVSCATCMMRDLCSVAVSAKKLLRPAQKALYGDIQLVGADAQAQKKRLKLSFGSRLVLLRRTLRAKPHIAAMVHSLKPPAVPQGVAPDLYQNLVASVVMACPNLERLVGFHPNHDFSFNRLFHALSTRGQLKEMHWSLEASSYQQTRRQRRKSNAAPMTKTGGRPDLRGPPPADLHPRESEGFLDLHARWSQLRTFSIHCRPGATLTPLSLLPDILWDMPALRELHLSRLPHAAFNDANLASLPQRLETLTLAHLAGVSSAGVAAFARRPSSRSIRRLLLHHVDVASLPALGQVFSNLPRLESFGLAQQRAPVLPPDESIWLFPYLASPSLRTLHWDVPSGAGADPTTGASAGVGKASAADAILARSIAAGGFPALTALRTPHDPQALFQSLCRPRAQIELPTDKHRAAVIARADTASSTSSKGSGSNSSPISISSPTATAPGGGGGRSPHDHHTSSPSSSQQHHHHYSGSGACTCSDLAQARRAAQARLEAARHRPRFTLCVTGEDGALLLRRGLAGHLGTLGSRIAYVLTPTADLLDLDSLDADLNPGRGGRGRGGNDAHGGLVGVENLLSDDGGENLARDGGGGGGGGGTSGSSAMVQGEGCNGRWNSYDVGQYAAADRKEKEHWWHTERGRWSGLVL